MPWVMRRIVTFAGLAGLAGLAACDETASAHSSKAAAMPDSSALAQRSAQFAQRLAAPDSEATLGGAVARWIMPEQLKEISGLVLTDDGRLLGHGDEHAHVFEIDYRRGVLVKEFTLESGGTPVKGDFEGITTANGSVILFTSDGKLYQFKEGPDGAKLDFTMTDTHLGAQCEFEGVTFEKPTGSLLLACKKVKDKKDKDFVVIYKWKLGADSSGRASKMTVPLADAIGSNEWDGLHPSDITIDPFNGNYVLIASRESAMFEVTPAGKVVFSRPLPGVHAQAEGIAITKDSLLIISDEAAAKNAKPDLHPHRVPDDGTHRPAYVTVYRWP